MRRLLPPQLHHMVGVYNDMTPVGDQEEIIDRMKDGQTLRYLFATEALDIDHCDIPIIDHVVQWGDPTSFEALEQRWGAGGRGPNAVKCRCVWFTSDTSFGPLRKPHSTSSPMIHDVTEQPPIVTAAALKFRNDRNRRTPELNQLCNLPADGYIRLFLRQASTQLTSAEKARINDEWKSPICPERCCLVCLKSYLKFGPGSAPPKRANKAAEMRWIRDHA